MACLFLLACDLPGPKVSDPFAPIPPLPPLPLLDRMPLPPMAQTGTVLFNPVTTQAVTGVAYLPTGQFDLEGVLIDGKLTALLKQKARPVGLLSGTLKGGNWQVPPHTGNWKQQAPSP